ncbi:MAG: sortase [candidate division SR1 bacterium]|nr:sortase [candidate division SR1 bacterium]
MRKRFRISFKSILIFILILSVLFTGFEMYKYIGKNPTKQVVSAISPKSNEEIKQLEQNTIDNKYFQDPLGEELSKTLKKYGIDMGFISTANILRLNQKIPISIKDADKIDKTALPRYETLDSIKPIPTTIVQKNMLIWDEYNIKVPLNYASFQDLFQANDDGTVNFDKSIDNNPTNSPVQQLLIQGIVHLPYSPLPGEQGNSYVIGHSSNYSSVKSDYNYALAPLIEKTKNGQIFKIYDYVGRELNFKVFDSVAVKEAEIGEAYKNFGDRRIVTLQGSILEDVNGKKLPTKRWLVRAELVQ